MRWLWCLGTGDRGHRVKGAHAANTGEELELEGNFIVENTEIMHAKCFT